MELDVQSLFGLHVHSCTHWLRPRNLPPPHVYSCTHWLRPRNPPPPRIWAHIGGRNWSAKIDDIFCDPQG
jgi:hypothetical protein